MCIYKENTHSFEVQNKKMLRKRRGKKETGNHNARTEEKVIDWTEVKDWTEVRRKVKDWTEEKVVCSSFRGI